MRKSLEQRLIRLGYTNPNLRNHIRPILDTLNGVDSGGRRRRTAGRRSKRADVIKDNYPVVDHMTEYDWIPEEEFRDLEKDLRRIAGQMRDFTPRGAKKVAEEMSDRIHEIYAEYASVAESFMEGNLLPMKDIGADRRLQRYFKLEEMHEEDPGYFYRDLEMFIEQANKDAQRFLASVFEDLYHKAERSEDRYEQQIADEYWETAQHIRDRGF